MSLLLWFFRAAVSGWIHWRGPKRQVGDEDATNGCEPRRMDCWAEEEIPVTGRMWCGAAGGSVCCISSCNQMERASFHSRIICLTESILQQLCEACVLKVPRVLTYVSHGWPVMLGNNHMHKYCLLVQVSKGTDLEESQKWTLSVIWCSDAQRDWLVSHNAFFVGVCLLFYVWGERDELAGTEFENMAG